MAVVYCCGQANSSPRVRAVAEDELNVSYVADEKSIRKLSEIVRERVAQKSGSPDMTYKVTFSDHSYYETDSLDTVLSEENPSTRQIVGAEIDGKTRSRADATQTDDSSVVIALSDGRLRYSVKGGDRDWVINTQTDIVDRFRLMETSSYGVPVLCAATGVSLVIAVLYGLGWVLRNRAERSVKDDGDKREQIRISEYLIELWMKMPFLPFMATMWLFWGLLCVAGFTAGFTGYSLGRMLFPLTTFAVGEGASSYAQIRGLRSNLLWGVFVALLISVIAGLLKS
jgi:hypothetical protein